MDISDTYASVTMTAIFEDEEAGAIAPQSELDTHYTSAVPIEKEETPDADLCRNGVSQGIICQDLLTCIKGKKLL